MRRAPRENSRNQSAPSLQLYSKRSLAVQTDSSYPSLRDLAVVSEAQLDCGSVNRLIRGTYSGQALDLLKELRISLDM